MSVQSRPVKELLPYLRLLEKGTLTKNSSNSEAIKRALELQWATLSSRAKTVLLTDRGRGMLPRYLDNVWPSWKTLLHELKRQELPVSMDGVKELEMRKRALSVSLPPRAHHKTLSAALGTHSKTGISNRLNELAGDIKITVDQVLRIHANRGLILRGLTEEVNCDPLMDIIGEVVLPERAFLDGIYMAGVLPQAILTVENLGLFIDLPPVPLEVIVVFVPGKNTTLAIDFLNLLGADIAHIHFGDLDPEGLDIAKTLTRDCPQRMTLFSPSFGEEAIDIFSGFKDWPEKVPFEDQVPLISRLKSERRWLEQERVAFDPRLPEELWNELKNACHLSERT